MNRSAVVQPGSTHGRCASSVYLFGAIVGKDNTDICAPAELVATKFNALVIKRLFDAQDAAYFSSQGMTDGYTVEVLRQGIVYGCKFFG